MAAKTQATPTPATAATTREELLAQHAEARRRRAAAPLGSEAWREAVLEIERIEVAIAALERSLVPPRV